MYKVTKSVYETVKKDGRIVQVRKTQVIAENVTLEQAKEYRRNDRNVSITKTN